MAATVKGRGTGRASAASWLGKLRGSAKDASGRAASDAAQRKDAGSADNSIILNAKDVHGEYDAGRVLYTTLGGENRAITHDDLKTFQHNIRTVQSRFKGGIRARQVLDLSLPDDRSRANKEIRMAVPVSASAGKVRFMTNSGPDSKVSHHHVIVNFLSYSAAASAGRDTPKKMAAWLRKEPLRIECTCGRWRYWYRYIATIGNFNAGRDETGFPKIRNPNLHGVACKHILRVMAEVESSTGILGFLEKLISKARNIDDNAAKIRMSQKEADQLAAKQSTNGRDVDTSMKRRAAAREKAAITRAAQVAPRLSKKPAATRRIEAALASGKMTQADLASFRKFGQTDAQIANMLKKE